MVKAFGVYGEIGCGFWYLPGPIWHYLWCSPTIRSRATWCYFSGDYNPIINEATWVGLTNYVDVLQKDTQMGIIMRNTVVFTVAVVVPHSGLGSGCALLLNQKLRFRNGVRSLLFSPAVLAGSAVAVIWLYLRSSFGLIYQLLKPLGITSPGWLIDPQWAMIALIIVYVWKNVGYATVIYIAGLQAIPADLYEAARVDGAGAWERFRNVTLPGLSPVTFFLGVTSVLNSFQAFDMINVLTRGGPINSTKCKFDYRLYEQGFTEIQNYGRASVVATLLFVIMFIVTLIQLRTLERRVSYA